MHVTILQGMNVFDKKKARRNKQRSGHDGVTDY
jgi:hypothetical protein